MYEYLCINTCTAVIVGVVAQHTNIVVMLNALEVNI